MTEYQEKRGVPRFNFIASVDINEPASGMRLAGRISELSRKGCYIDVLNTLPMGTTVQLRITRDRGTFATTGNVIYVQEPMGMGVAFAGTPPDQLQVLDLWLEELSA